MNKQIFISKLEHLLYLDIKYFTKNSLFAIAQQIVGVICGLILTYIIGHNISKEIYGEYNLVLSYIGLLTFFSLPGIDIALIQSVGKGFDKSFIYGFRSKFKFSFLGTLFLILFAIYNLSINNIELGNNLLLGAISYPFLYSFTIYSSFLIAKKRFDLLAIINSLSSVIYLSTFILFIKINPTSTKLILAYSIGSFLPALIGFIYSKKLILNKKRDKQLFSYGSFLTILSILPWIAGNLGNIILGHLLGIEALAIYSVAYSFLVSIQKIFMVFYKPVTAKLAEQSTKNHLDTIKKHSVNLIIMGVCLYVIIWIMLPVVVRFFYNPSYYSVIYYSRLICLALIPLPFAWVLNDITVYQKRKKAQIFISVFPQVMKIVLYFITIPIWGIYGLILIFLVDRYLTPLFNFLLLIELTYKKII